MKNKFHNTINILELTPKQLLGFEYRNDGNIDVLVPRFKNHILQKMIPKRRSPYIKANLDELGTATWKLIDGIRKVSDIAEKLNERFEDADQIPERVSLFLQNMNSNKFITFIELLEK